MPIFEISHPDGRTFEVDAPDMNAAASAFKQYTAPQAPQPNVAADIAQSAAIAVPQTAIGFAGLPGGASELIGKAVRAGLRAAGLNVPPEEQAAAAQSKLLGGADIAAPTAPAIQSAVENVTGPFYQPQTLPGQYANTATQFALGGAAGGAGIIPSALTGLASEAAGQLTKGTAAEPYARLGTAIATPLAGTALSRTLTRQVPAANAPFVQTLQQEGVPLTAGAMTGSRPMQWLEQSVGDVFGTGRAATKASERTAEGFTRAVLARGGEMANRATPEVIDRAFTRIGNKFDTLSARNVLHPDPQFGQDMQAGLNDYRGIVSPPNRAPILENFEAEIGTTLAKNGGTIPGTAFQSLTSRLERAARGAAGQPEVADTLRDMRSALNDAMERSMARVNSPDLGQWRTARQQYRNMLTIEKAATVAGEGAAHGLISPSALRNAVVNAGRRAYARGQGDLAELARAGEAILKPLPSSGTAQRGYAMHALSALGSGLGALAGGFPGAAVGAVAPLAGAALAGRVLMSRPTQAALRSLTARQAPLRTGVSASLPQLPYLLGQ